MRYPYMIWLWLETAWDQSVIQEDGSPQISLLAAKGSEALAKTMTTMSMEVPLITLAEEFAAKALPYSCNVIWNTVFNLTED